MRWSARLPQPKLALLVEIEQIFFHCSKSFLRSRAWDPDTWRPDALPPRARLSKALERRNDPIEVLEEHYGARYAEHLYD